MKKLLKKRMLLHKGIRICTFFVMVFFLNILISNRVLAYEFKFTEFDWDSFSEENKEFWLQGCEQDGNTDSKCEARILNSQKKFYKKFYKILAKYERKKILLPDGIDPDDTRNESELTEEELEKRKAMAYIYEFVDDLVVETIFFELTPSQFADDATEYKSMYEPANGEGGYIIDESDIDDPQIDIDYNSDDVANYYDNEKDTLKILMKNLIASTTTCFGLFGDPTEHTTQNGEKYYTCDNGGVKTEVKGFGTKCADNINTFSLGFWKYHISKLMHDQTLRWFTEGTVFRFLKRVPIDENYETCMAYESSYPEGAAYVFNDDEIISTDRYFDFLSYNTYFDKKAHLQYRYKESILIPADVDCMTDDVCENSLESKGTDVVDSYEGEAIKIRREIIEDILFIMDNYGYEIIYDPVNGEKYVNAEASQNAARKSYYWPIGSDEIEERNGIKYADGEPASTDIISPMGTRENPITGEVEEHYGIDIAGIEGVTNIVAVYQGEIISIVSNCTVGDYSCNNGLGNEIIISHPNGDYTVYAHLASIESGLSVGSTVDKGQLIAKLGRTGETKEACLHYEIRKGGNDVSHAVDPTIITSGDNPRPAAAEGDFSTKTTTLTREEFINYLKNYCVTNSCKSEFMNVFVAHAGEVYDASIANGVNPELVVVRAISEGLSPGGKTYNYWGIGCTNTGGSSACKTYSSLSDGIRGFANVGPVKNNQTISGMMSNYAYIGTYWYNPGSWGLGGCIYYPYIKEYMSSSRSSEVGKICSGSLCSKSGGSGCVKTTSEDQQAYSMYNASKMVNLRYSIFGL